MTEGTTPGLAAVIRERSSEILARWIVQFERSLLRFRRATKAATHTAQVANLVEALSVAVSSGSHEVKPGANVTRELDGGIVEVRLTLEATTSYLERVDRRDHEAVSASLRPFFAPRSLAVIGASSRRGSIGAPGAAAAGP